MEDKMSVCPEKKDYSIPAIEVLQVVAPEEFCVVVASGESNQGSGEDMPWG